MTFPRVGTFVLASLAALWGCLAAEQMQHVKIPFSEKTAIQTAERKAFEELSLRISELEEVELQSTGPPQFFTLDYHMSSTCSGFSGVLLSMKLDTCFKARDNKLSYKFFATEAKGAFTVTQQVYSKASCAAKNAIGKPTKILSKIPTGCVGGGGGPYLQAAVVTSLHTHADFAGGVRTTIYNTQAACLLDQDASSSGYRMDPPEDLVRELSFASLGWCMGGTVFGDFIFHSCQRHYDVNGQELESTFFVSVYKSEDGSCTGKRDYFTLGSKNFCRNRLQSYYGTANGYMSMTCF